MPKIRGIDYQQLEDAVSEVGINTDTKELVLTVVAPSDFVATGTTSVNASTSVTGVGSAFLTQIGMGDRLSVSSLSGTYATVTGISSNTGLTLSQVLGNGTSQTINVKKGLMRIDTTSVTGAFVMNDLGQIGVSTLLPTAQLTVTSPAGQLPEIHVSRVDDSGNPGFTPTIRGRYARFGIAAVQANDLLLGIVGQGNDGTSYANGATILLQAAGTWSGSSHPTQVQFFTIPTASTASSFVMLLDSSQNVSIGSPLSDGVKLQVSGPAQTSGSATKVVQIFDTTTATTGTGGGISFGGYTNGTSTQVDDFGNIKGIKENSSGGNNASALVFSTRANGGSPTEAVRISSSQFLGIGAATPAAKLHVNGAVYRTAQTNGTIASPAEEQGVLSGSGISSIANPAGMYFLNSFNQNSASWLSLKTTTGGGVTNTAMIIDSSGDVLIPINLTINNGTSATNNASMVVYGPVNNPCARFYGNATTGQSFGVTVYGGSNSSDNSFNVFHSNQSTLYMNIRGDGLIQMGGSSANPSYVDPNGIFYIGTSGATQLISSASLNVKGANGGIAAGDGTNGGFLTGINSNGNVQGYIALGRNFSGISAGNMGIGLANNADNASKLVQVINRTGGVQLSDGATSWAAISDEKKKDIIEPIADGLEKVGKLRAVIGKYKTDDEGKRRSFLIAQDVEKVLPEAVSVSNDEENSLLLQYTDVIPLLVAAIKDLKTQFEEYKASHP